MRAGPDRPRRRAADTPSARTTWPSERSLATSVSTRSSRSTGSTRRGAPPLLVSSSLASASRSATSSSSRSLSLSTVVATVGQWARCGWRLATSTVVRIVASGLRSSWDASDTNWRWRCCAASSRSSMSFIVCASRATSSSVAGSSMRRWRVAWLISSTSWRMRSTGRRARPTSHQVTIPTRTTSSGMPTHSEEASVWTLRRTSSSGDAATSVYSPSGFTTVRVTTA